MRIKLVSLEDGITACGFRKVASYVAGLNADTTSYYVCTRPHKSVLNVLRGTFGGKGELDDDDVEEVAQELAKNCDLLGFSSMTGYADLTRRIMTRVRELSPATFIVWGGIHPIIHPEDAIDSPVDAICTGEGEFAFQQLYDHLQADTDYSKVSNFWFKRDGEISRNGFLPLMTTDEMETMPFPQYGAAEKIYRQGRGFDKMRKGDYLANDGLAYSAIWSIGCPFHCSFCGNTKFIANDPKYKKVRHTSPRYIVDEIRAVRRRFPHVSQVNFYDDSFMAIPYREIEQFSEHWREELGIPFTVYGVIPNYVNKDKFEILTWAGMNRVRMGIQSGSQAILDFYKRPTPPERILAAGEVISEFSPKYHIPPAYDIIVDNPIETRQDVVDTLELLYKMPRPYTLFIYSLKVIPNTDLERDMRERGVDIEEISDNYLQIPPRVGNLLLYVLALWRPPRWLFDRWLRHVRASSENPKTYPTLGSILRTLYFARNVVDYLRFMDFSHINGWPGWVAWRSGLIGLWRKHFNLRPPRPTRAAPSARFAVAAGGDAADAAGGTDVEITSRPAAG
ncbi:MAG TPA: radical SAM protein [Acidimicrobiales bacterium]|nr:radical SAM protein [Acidimicrobiales bacterium]